METLEHDATLDRRRTGDAARVWGGALARGLVLGLGLGVAFRGWMRLISTDPEFSWSGTIFILMVCTIAATGASLARTARARFQSRAARAAARTLGTIAVLTVGMGAGALVLPIWLCAGLALGRRDWHPWVRRALAGAAALATVGAVVTIAESFPALGVVRSVLSVPTLLAIMAAVAVLFSWPTRTPPARVA
ncbi:MAG: hypothetical protein ACLGIR_00340 [Actinomycetes bacterium]